MQRIKFDYVFVHKECNYRNMHAVIVKKFISLTRELGGPEIFSLALCVHNVSTVHLMGLSFWMHGIADPVNYLCKYHMVLNSGPGIYFLTATYATNLLTLIIIILSNSAVSDNWGLL